MPETLLLGEKIQSEKSSWKYNENPINEFINNYWFPVLTEARSFNNAKYYFITPTDSSIMSWTIQNKLPEYFDQNFDLLQGIFDKEYKKLHQNLKVSKGVIFKVFENICRYVAQLEFKNGTVELTSNCNIKFTLVFAENKVLMVTKYLKPENLRFKEGDIVFSLFVNKKLIASDVSEISYFVSGFKKYLAM